MLSEAMSSSGKSETAITLGYRLVRNMNRESPPRTHSRSTDSRSTSSRDSRTYIQDVVVQDIIVQEVLTDKQKKLK
ncbi:hypothetical protein TNCV_859011 [Trichonephila clavipes]|nr:hypothetical protein TNCV_859011 [Trichonephila clavipes]